MLLWLIGFWPIDFAFVRPLAGFDVPLDGFATLICFVEALWKPCGKRVCFVEILWKTDFCLVEILRKRLQHVFGWFRQAFAGFRMVSTRFPPGFYENQSADLSLPIPMKQI